MKSTEPTRVDPASAGLRGAIQVPGDKSISHRAFLINALGQGSCRIRGALDAEDVAASRGLVRALGVRLEREGAAWILHPGPLKEPAGVIDCGNSGTTMRLGAGLCVHQPGLAVLTGDASLRHFLLSVDLQLLSAYVPFVARIPYDFIHHRAFELGQLWYAATHFFPLYFRPAEVLGGWDVINARVG